MNVTLAVIACAVALMSPFQGVLRMKLAPVLVFTTAPNAAVPSAYRFQADRGGRKGQTMFVSTASDVPKDTPGTMYRLIASDKAGPLPDVDVLGIHYLKVKPERAADFERFVGDVLHPGVGNLRPDLRLLYYKAVSGPETGGYILIFGLTRESRDKYWPGGADSDELRTAFKPLRSVADALLPYLVEGSALTDEKFAARVFESREWADFVLVPGR